VPDGIDMQRVTAFLEENVVGAHAPFTFELIGGGRSNLTYRVTDGHTGVWVLRRPPTGHVLETAHDMLREFRIITALGDTSDVPVPQTFAFCDDADVTGAPFNVMSYIDGAVVRDEGSAALLDATVRAAASKSALDVLLRLHGPDPDEVGLGDLGRREAYVARQLKRWYGQFQQVTRRRIPALDEAHRLLSESVPIQQKASVVHGDYRLDNLVVSPVDGTVLSVLDWEVCTLGDPLADLGQLLVYWVQPGDPVPDLLGAPTVAGGFASRDDLVGWYSAGSDLDLSQLDYYVAFGYWRVACILEGVLSRSVAGAGGGDAGDPRAYEHQVPVLAEAALEMARRLAG
jgi:aminoglycoside phosphotransferase (APT) family kinase protein